MEMQSTKQATREELIDRIKELEQTNLELLTRLRADSLSTRDKWWIKKIEKVMEDNIFYAGYNVQDEYLKGKRDENDKIMNELEKMLGEIR